MAAAFQVYNDRRYGLTEDIYQGDCQSPLSDSVKRILLCTLLREPLKVKRMNRAGESLRRQQLHLATVEGVKQTRTS